MKMTRIFLIVWLLAGSASAQNPTGVLADLLAPQEPVFDSNTAFYEGEKYTYLFGPPHGFELNTSSSTDDGYSFAFVPKEAEYDSAPVMIGISIFKAKVAESEKFFESFLSADTAAISEHYGKGLYLAPVDSLVSGSDHPLKTFFINDRKRFIPTVMVSYFDGEAEVLVFELNIVEGSPRFIAEDQFLDCLINFKALVKGKLD